MGSQKNINEVQVLATAEYIWLDGASPTQDIRTKTRILSTHSANKIEDFPEWGFDGSSTWQAHGSHSDCVLKPVYFCLNPLRTMAGNHYVVVCEVYESDGQPHSSNARHNLKELLNKSKGTNPWIGFEQEYTFFEYTRPLGWPDKGGFPEPQGPFYCGVGENKVFGRDIVEEHMDVCQRAGLSFYGINAEVMPSQWEFQVGYRGVSSEASDPLSISDQMWIARYMLKMVAEKYGVIVSFSNKPMPGDWNGAGMHTNFSTNATREKGTGLDAINKVVENLKKNHSKDIRKYGAGLEERLTGLHETCHIGQFRSGVSDRGASIRIPLQTSQNSCGYFEDRRPGANADPYKVSACLVEAACF